MRTMYKVIERVYMDCDGHNTMWRAVDNYVATIEEAKAITCKVNNYGYATGDWKIIAKTIDEEAFEVKEEEIATNIK